MNNFKRMRQQMVRKIKRLIRNEKSLMHFVYSESLSISTAARIRSNAA